MKSYWSIGRGGAPLVLLVLPLVAGACYTRGEPPPVPAATAEEASDPGETLEIVDSERISDLDQVGVRLEAPLAETIAEAKKADTKAGKGTRVKAIMQAFNKSLGVECKFCHAEKLDADGEPVLKDGKPSLDFEKETAEKNVTVRMWNDWVLKLRFAESETRVFCDSCHQGSAAFLDRSEPKQLGAWMKQNFGAKLIDQDGEHVKCSSCHGKPFAGEFLESWREGGEK